MLLSTKLECGESGKYLNLFYEQKYSNFISVIIFEIIRKKFKNMIVYC